MPLSIALLSPVPPDTPTGNAVTVGRVAQGLAARGVDARVWHAADTALGGDGAWAGPGRPAVVHAFHAYRTGPLAHLLAERAGAPLVVTLTGTDVSHDLEDPERGPVVRQVLKEAAAVTAFHASVARAVAERVPEVGGRLAIVPQSVAFDPARAAAPAVAGDPCVLFPAGIRPVKQPRLPLAPLAGVRRRRPELALWYAGPVLDEDEMEALRAAMAGHPWARYLGAVPHGAMPGLLGAADIVLNCSLSEGGMSNAVLEALSLGRTVVASDIPGNRSVVEDGVTGLLFREPAELAAQVERLAGDPALRARLGAAGRRLVAERFTPEAESAGYLAVYARVTGDRVP